MSTIPKIIHQIWFKFREGGENVPEEYVVMRKKWKEMNPEWTFVLWNDKSARDLIQRHYPEHLEVYDSYKEPIRRCDAFRFFVLHHVGGFYCDLDTTPSNTLNDLINNEVVLVKDVNPMFYLNNGFMGSIPQHPLMKKCYEGLKVSKALPGAILSTGPVFLSANYLTFKEPKDKIKILSVKELKTYFTHHHHASWTPAKNWYQAIDKDRRQYMKQEDVPLLLRPFVKVGKKD